MIGDFRELSALERAAFTRIGSRFYPLEDIEVALDTLDGLTPALIEEEHYFVLVRTGGSIIASGGWSRAAPDYGAHYAAPDAPSRVPGAEAIVRCVYVHPDHERRGHAKRIMQRIEEDALSHDVGRLSLTSSRTALPLYRSLGYAEGPVHTVRLPNGRGLDLQDMHKALACGR
jgi:GNAT superfamily N-acetyltransferase